MTSLKMLKLEECRKSYFGVIKMMMDTLLFRITSLNV